MTELEEHITPRMRMVLSMVPRCESCCDVGTDHGYIALALAKRGVKVIAADVNPGPLAAARENIRLYGGNVEARLSDGFSALKEGEAQCAVLAGMGGELIADIIGKGTKGVKTLVLQPQSLIYKLREFLSKEGYIITDENICREDNRFYAAMLAEKGSHPQSLGLEEKLIGPCLLKKRPEILKDYLENEIRIVRTALEKIERSSAVTQKKREYEDLIKIYKKVLMEKW